MALMKGGLWGMVSGNEEAPGEENADAQRQGEIAPSRLFC